MKAELFSKEDWLDRMYRKSESQGTKNCANTAIISFDYFCQNQIGLNGWIFPSIAL